MSGTSSIEWTDKTWNPVRGCSIVSKGCTNCYAMKVAHRFSGAGQAYEGLTMMTKGGPVWTGKMRLVDNELHTPYHWTKPSRIFVNSMSDLFHDGVPDGFIARVWFVMASNQQHVFQILTKRPERMLEWVSRHGQDAVFAGEREEHEVALKKHGWPLRNVWLGVSAEDQDRFDQRVELLGRTPAAVRFVSAEPLLSYIDVGNAFDDGDPYSKVDWIIAGGESGPGARPLHPDWVRHLRDQCDTAGVPFFFKQWGGHIPGEILRGAPTLRWQDGRTEWYGDHQDIKYQRHWLTNDERKLVIAWPTRKKAAGRMLDGRTHDAYPA